MFFFKEHKCILSIKSGIQMIATTPKQKNVLSLSANILPLKIGMSVHIKVTVERISIVTAQVCINYVYKVGISIR